jgi:hypothetical protein
MASSMDRPEKPEVMWRGREWGFGNRGTLNKEWAFCKGSAKHGISLFPRISATFS